jgi:DNA-directed RNA polymerase subunit RPC12/RpoP
MENLDNRRLITCPYCNKKYFPSEIFVPKNFVGTASFIDEYLYIGADMDLEETYTCDSCNNIFNITAEVSFTSSKSRINSFDENF